MADADLEIGAPSANPELTQGSPVAGVACSKWLPSSGGVTPIFHSLILEYPWRVMRLLMTVYAGMGGVGWSRMGEA